MITSESHLRQVVRSLLLEDVSGDLLLEVSYDHAKQNLFSNATAKALNKVLKGPLASDDAAQAAGLDGLLEYLVRHLTGHDVSWTPWKAPWAASKKGFGIISDHPDFGDSQRIPSIRAGNPQSHEVIIPPDIDDKQKATTLLWLLKLLKENPTRFWTEIEEILEERRADRAEHRFLEPFFHYKYLMPEKDLMKIPGLWALGDMVDSVRPEIRKHQEGKKYLDAEKGTTILRDDDDWRIAIITNKGAACELGKGTDWCTAAPGLDYFKTYYREDDPLFYFLDKKTPPGDPGADSHPATNIPDGKGGYTTQYGNKFQFHYGSRQFNDFADGRVDTGMRDKLHRMLKATGGADKFPEFRRFDQSLVAHDPASTAEELNAVIPQALKDKNIGAVVIASKNPSISEESLRVLASPSWLPLKNKHRRRELANAVAGNPSASVATLRNLFDQAKDLLRSAHPSSLWYSRVGGAERRATSHDIIDSLSKNPNTPADIIDIIILGDDSFHEVLSKTSLEALELVGQAVEHPNASADTLVKAVHPTGEGGWSRWTKARSKQRWGVYVVDNVVKNPNFPTDEIRNLMDRVEEYDHGGARNAIFLSGRNELERRGKETPEELSEDRLTSRPWWIR
tara:strand:- start:3802 stop:5670 length:1869 start_codon:yes stop_codon:yes gene_type:complete